jgi:hypothetical protein
MDIINARIEGTSLGFERGNFTCMLHFKYGSTAHGFGGYQLAGSAFGIEFLARVLKAAGVNYYEELRGTLMRIRLDGCVITAIGHITDDKWFNPEELSQK